jgi:hypothetical protein
MDNQALIDGKSDFFIILEIRLTCITTVRDKVSVYGKGPEKQSTGLSPHDVQFNMGQH